MRVDHVHVGVLVVREGLADVPLQTLEARRRSAPLPLGVQATEQVVDAYLGVGKREVESMVVAALGPEPLLEGLELRELVAANLPRPEDPPEVGGVHVFCASVVPHLGRYRGLSLTQIFLFAIKTRFYPLVKNETKMKQQDR